jgi:DNA polymerase-3 subunit chi
MAVYFVETTAAEQRHLLCRWTERFYMEKKRVQVLVESMAAAQLVDALLWTFSQPSFIPHLILSRTGDPPEEPVIVTPEPVRIRGFETLVCDCPADVDFMGGFESAVHFILKDDPERTKKSREIWQEAREAGLNPVHVPYVKVGAGGD